MNYYLRSLKEFKRKLKENSKMTKEEWDKYAHENYFFSSMTLEAHFDVYSFNVLKKMVQRQL